MNSKQKLEENGDVLPDWKPNRGINYISCFDFPEGKRITTLKEYLLENNPNKGILYDYAEKPEQYQIGIDTFARAEANMNFEEIMACCRFNIDKYTWRKKGQDIEDFKKIIAYAEFGIKQLEK